MAVTASPEDCFALLCAVDSYPNWNPELVREVEVLEWDSGGRPARARVTLHVAQSPFAKDFELVVAVRAEQPGAVYIIRVPNEPSDRERVQLAWRLHGNGGTHVELAFEATASFVPAFLPLPGVGNLIARTLLEAAANALGPAPP